MDNIGDLSSIKKEKEGIQTNGIEEINATTELFDQINNTTQMIIEIANKNFDYQKN